MKNTFALMAVLLVLVTFQTAPGQSAQSDKTGTTDAADLVAVPSPSPIARDAQVAAKTLDPTPASQGHREGFKWGPALRQTLTFLSLQQTYALTAQAKTRRELKGPFFKDYFRSVRSLHGWSDGGRFFTNYVAHPMEGSFLGFVQVQNDPAGMHQRFSMSKSYWKSRAKALAWSAAWSTQFEIGPVSQASIGNVGLHGKQTWVDIIVTPTVGIGMLVSEDLLDRFVIRRLERRSKNFWLKLFTRTLLNPTRTSANIMRMKTPWYRDAGLR